MEQIGIIRGKLIKEDHPRYWYLYEIEKLIQDTKNNLWWKQSISLELFQKLHNLYLYV